VIELWAIRPGFDSLQGRFFSLFDTAFGARLASCPVSSQGSFPGGKSAGVWGGWPLDSVWCRNWECVELYLHPPIHIPGVLR